AEGRNVRPLAGSEVHRQHVLTVEIEVRRQVKRERRVAAPVFAETLAVDPHGGGGHGTFEVHENAVAACLGRELEAAAVAGNELITLFIKAVPGQPNVGV